MRPLGLFEAFSMLGWAAALQLLAFIWIIFSLAYSIGWRAGWNRALELHNLATYGNSDGDTDADRDLHQP